MKKRMTAWQLSMLPVFLVLCSSPAALAQQVYDLDIVARTGVPVGSGTPVALAPGPSINDAGKVAFVARNIANTQANGRVMLLNNGVIEEDCPVGPLRGAVGILADDFNQEAEQ